MWKSEEHKWEYVGEVVDPNATPVTFVGVPIVGTAGTDVGVTEEDEDEANAFP